MRPIIGLTIYEGVSKSELPISAVNTAYIEAIQLAGGIPVLIPNQLTESGWDEVYKRLDGILFTGGGDISIERFNGVPHPTVDEVDSRRDSLEIDLFKLASQDGKPFLGICRGCQLVNVALGGTLYTHIPDQLPGAVKHDWYPGIPRNAIAHAVQLEPGSRTVQIVGETLLQVNSLHHQGIKDLALGLIAVGFSPDGLVEAVELKDHPFGLAVQWHPEWLTDQVPMRSLFEAFILASSA